MQNKDQQLRSMLLDHADPVRSEHEARYLKLAKRPVIGTTVPTAQRVAEAYVAEYGLPYDHKLLDVWFHGSFEEALCAIDFLAAQPSRFGRETWALVESWSQSPETWALADPISALLVAGHLEAGVISESVLREWAAREEPFWYRRIALVSTTSLNRGGVGAPTRRHIARLGQMPSFSGLPRPRLTLDLLEASIHDRRHFIRLGIGWALRELARIDEETAASFVTRHRSRFTKAMLDKARLDERGRPKS